MALRKADQAYLVLLLAFALSAFGNLYQFLRHVPAPPPSSSQATTPTEQPDAGTDDLGGDSAWYDIGGNAQVRVVRDNKRGIICYVATNAGWSNAAPAINCVK